MRGFRFGAIKILLVSGYNDNEPARLTNGENARDEFCNVVTLYVPDLFSNI